jgi:adenine C2-methylase RlmN of 23S rRNA A2503 and tRNA A37
MTIPSKPKRYQDTYSYIITLLREKANEERANAYFSTKKNLKAYHQDKATAFDNATDIVEKALKTKLKHEANRVRA